MFKLLNLVAAIFLLYDFINKTYLFEAAAKTNDYSALAYNGTGLLIDTLFLVAIYITVFGSSEVYVTTQVVKEKEEDS